MALIRTIGGTKIQTSLMLFYESIILCIIGFFGGIILSRIYFSHLKFIRRKFKLFNFNAYLFIKSRINTFNFTKNWYYSRLFLPLMYIK